MSDALTLEGRVTMGGTGVSGVTITANARSATTDRTGFYSISNLPSGACTVVPSKLDHTFTPPSRFLFLSSDASNVDFEASLVSVYRITGTAWDGTNGLGGVGIEVNGTERAITDGNGQYTVTNLQSGSYLVQAVRSNDTFNPISRFVSIQDENVSGVDFTRVYAISGRIMDGSSPVAGVTVQAGGRTANTSSNGSYRIANLVAGSYELVPRLTGYNFAPTSKTVTVGPDATNANFAAFPVYSISGRVLEGTNGLGGVSLSAGDRNTASDSNGYYTLTNLPVGHYFVQPTLAGYEFEPGLASVTLNSSTNGVDFSAIPLFTVTGRVTAGTNAVSNVQVFVGTQSTLTDSNGVYALSVRPGIYRVAPAAEHQPFNPGSRWVNLGPGVAGADFNLGTNVYPVAVNSCEGAAFHAALAEGSPIRLDCSGIILLTNTVVVSNALTLVGSNGSAILSGGGRMRVFQVQSNATLALDGITVAHGYDPQGAGIFNDGGFVTLMNSLVYSNWAVGPAGEYSTNVMIGYSGTNAYGGGIYNRGGTVKAIRSVLDMNVALGGRGADGPPGSISGGRIGGAGGSGFGGSIFNEGGTVELLATTLSGNQAEGGVGGWGGHGVDGSFGTLGSEGGPAGHGSGGAVANNNGVLRVRESAFISNYATGGRGGTGGSGGSHSGPGSGGSGGRGGNGGLGQGAGIHDVAGVVHALNVTLGANRAQGGTGGFGGSRGFGGTSAGNSGSGGRGGNSFGGGAFLHSASASFTNNSFNTSRALPGFGGSKASGTGGSDGQPGIGFGGSVAQSNSTVILANSILAFSLSEGNCFGNLIDGGYNISSDASCVFGSTGLINTDPRLAPLAYNGGPTATYALLPDSPAIDRPVETPCPSVDQRGNFRPSGIGCDIGAFEFYQPTLISRFDPGSGKDGTAVTLQGTSLAAATEVRLGDVAATVLTNTATTLTFRVPAGAITGPIFIQTPNGPHTTSNRFMVDRLPPSLVVMSPRPETLVTALNSISGQAMDNLDGSGLVGVWVYIQRQRDFAFWTGSGWGGPTALAARLSGVDWFLTSESLDATALEDGPYHLLAETRDHAGNVFLQRVRVTVDRSGGAKSIARLPNGNIILRFAGVPGRRYRVDATTDFVTWANLGVLVCEEEGILQWTDVDAPNYLQRFYRTSAP